MYSVRKSCQSALRNSNGVYASANVSHRAFSRSAAQLKGGLPVFLEPSSTELQELLASINAKVLLPEHFSREQEKLVYKQASRSKLETEPVEVTIGNVTLPLEHIDRLARPSRWGSLKQVVHQSESAADWENVVRVLEGYHAAGINTKADWQELVVRKLIENGQQSLVLKALQRVKATGLRLSNYKVTQRSLKGAHDRASLSNWERDETIQALRFARQIVEMMEDEEHHSILSKGAKLAQTDWRGKPFVIAVPTELAAVVAQKHGGEVETVKAFANRLVHALKQDNFPESLDSVSAASAKTEADYKGKTNQTDAVNAFCNGLFELLTIWNALKTSKSVLGADMPLAADAAGFEDKIKTVLFSGVDALPKLHLRDGLELRTSFPAYIRDQMSRCQS